jgi:hypothetical protein
MANSDSLNKFKDSIEDVYQQALKNDGYFTPIPYHPLQATNPMKWKITYSNNTIPNDYSYIYQQYPQWVYPQPTAPPPIPQYIYLPSPSVTPSPLLSISEMIKSLIENREFFITTLKREIIQQESQSQLLLTSVYYKSLLGIDSMAKTIIEKLMFMTKCNFYRGDLYYCLTTNDFFKYYNSIVQELPTLKIREIAFIALDLLIDELIIKKIIW